MRATAVPGSPSQAGAGATPASSPAPASPVASASGAAPVFAYVDGQLSIRAFNVTLADVLLKVASLTGVKFDVPPGASAEKMPLVEVGPGTAREVLADLLSDSTFDYVLSASDGDPDKIQSVLLMPREKKTARGSRMEVASRSIRSPYARAAAEAVLEPAAQQESAAVSAPADGPAPDAGHTPATPAAPAPASPSMPSTSVPIMQTNVPPTAPVPPPASLDQQSISQQLQQMYQQRAQMIQQTRQTATPATPTTNPPNN